MTLSIYTEKIKGVIDLLFFLQYKVDSTTVMDIKDKVRMRYVENMFQNTRIREIKIQHGH